MLAYVLRMTGLVAAGQALAFTKLHTVRCDSACSLKVLSDAMSAVSVIIPTYNRCSQLGTALASAERAIQPLSGSEIVVVDDASADGTHALLSEYQGRAKTILHSERRGACAARNAGLAVAGGQFVKFLDSDDVLEPDSLAHEVEVAKASGADLVVSGWGTRRLGEGGAIEEGSATEWDAPDISSAVDAVLAGKAVPTSAALYDRELAARTLWSTRLAKLQDWDFFCRAALGARLIASNPRLAYWWQDHPGPRVSTSATLATNARAHHAILDGLRATLEERGDLTPARRARLAQYYYKELSILCRFDEAAFEAGVQRIRSLDPRFSPTAEEPRRYMRLLARMIGFKNAILLYTWSRSRLRGSNSD